MSFTTEFKEKVVKENIKQHISSRELSKKYCIAEIHIRRWIKLYNYHGIAGLKHERKKYDGFFKINALKYMEENHLSFLETAMRFNIPKDTTVGNWYYKYKEKGTLKLPDNSIMKKEINNTNKRLEELEKENEYLRAENAYLKKLRALVQERNKQQNKKKQ